MKIKIESPICKKGGMVLGHKPARKGEKNNQYLLYINIINN